MTFGRTMREDLGTPSLMTLLKWSKAGQKLAKSRPKGWERPKTICSRLMNGFYMTTEIFIK